MSSADDAPPEDATPEQAEATAEADEAEGHAESTADAAAETAPAPEPEPEPADPTSPASEDEVRLAMLQVLKYELGDAVVGAHIRDGAELWVRVTPEAWREAGQIARGRLGCTYFCFLSVIDWLPAPWSAPAAVPQLPRFRRTESHPPAAHPSAAARRRSLHQ